MAQSGQLTACRCLLLPLWKFPNVIIFNWPWAPAPFFSGNHFSVSYSAFQLHDASSLTCCTRIEILVLIFWLSLFLAWTTNRPFQMRELCPAGALVSGLTQCRPCVELCVALFCPEDLTFSHCRSVIKIEKKSFIHSSAPQSMPVFLVPTSSMLGRFNISNSAIDRKQNSKEWSV